MSKFRKDGKKDLPAISTASLPDIVFMLLFFFMVATTMRDVELSVNYTQPKANELVKLEKKDLVSNIHVGVPLRKFQKTFGTEPRIQLNDQFATVADIQAFIASERESRKEELRNKLTTSLKVDQYTKMGIITDIKQELRKASSLKLNYSTRQTAE
ncbi:biopolymer transporter ExbD [Labilibaculum sp. DW002]|uniref:Biopolymer transporter ExbD n=1 Tax=Paralabilibaculum antarcticum TaxID=2912572 RepID=A0ABT5VXN0_9BACT|nr:biopolymer transporter ExbD [Labilibaculum sp. DW002]MDE5420173.1 biopolymer transporter ExbD [Labilibaculum sp. DW002]